MRAGVRVEGGGRGDQAQPGAGCAFPGCRRRAVGVAGRAGEPCCRALAPVRTSFPVGRTDADPTRAAASLTSACLLSCVDTCLSWGGLGAGSCWSGWQISRTCNC